MSTSNFYNRNASKVFAIEFEDEYDYDDTVANLTDILNGSDFDSESGYEQGLRSYSGRYIASKSVSKRLCGMEAIVTIRAILRSGYYSGANIDWELEYIYEDKAGVLPDSADVTEVLTRYYDVNPGMASIQGKNIVAYMTKAAQSLIDELEEILARVTTPLVVVARFSNGETLYEAVGSRS